MEDLEFTLGEIEPIDFALGEPDTVEFKVGENPVYIDTRVWDVYEEDHSVVDPETHIAHITVKKYTSLDRLGSYLYKISFGELPEEKDISTNFISGCTSYVKDGKLYRNLDWDYDNTIEFLVQCKGFKGMAFIPGITDELENDILSQLPYHINDGINDDGIMVSSHVLYNDFEYEYDGEIPLSKIPFLILTQLHSMNDILSLQPYLSNIKVNQTLQQAEYLMQYLITDGTTTYLATPSDTGYELIDISSNPKITNFKWVNRATVSRNDADIQRRPTGIERFNMIPADLKDLKFTNAYISPNRLSEFIGIRETTKESTDEELLDIYNIAHQMFLERTRDGSTWQTLHSIVYSKNGIESLSVQENYDVDYADNGVKKEYVDEKITMEIDEHNMSTASHQDIRNELMYTDDEEIGGSYPIDADTLGGNEPDYYAGKEWVQDQGYLTEHQSLAGYATESWVEQQGYLTEHQSLEGYATEQWVEDKHYLTEHQSLSNYYTKSETDNKISNHHDSTKQNAITSSNKLSYSLLKDTPTIPTDTSIHQMGYLKLADLPVWDGGYVDAN